MFSTIRSRLNYNSLKKYYLTGYRTGGFFILTATMLALLGYGIVMMFFMFNTTWIAPTVLSSTSDKMLTFQSGYLSEHEAISTLKVVKDQQERLLKTNEVQLIALQSLAKEISNGNPLLRGKISDIFASMKLREALETVKQENAENLSKGLITRTEVVQASTYIQQFQNGITDSKVSFATLQQQLLQLQFQMETLADQINTGVLTLSETEKNLSIAEAAVNKLDATSYAHAMDATSNMAFLAYDNIKVAKIGAPVYDCYLMIIGCHKVGTISRIYNDEQLVDFPLFNVRLSRTVRGVMVDIDVSDSSAMRSTVLFVGSKPLFL